MCQEISFPAVALEETHDGPMIISTVLAGHLVRLIYVDDRSALEIMYLQCFQNLDECTQNLLLPVHAPLQSFSGEMIQPLGQLTFSVTLKAGSLMRTLPLTFLVVKARSVHNAIMGEHTFML